MGIIDFVKDAGEKLGLGKKEEKAKDEEFQELRKGNVLLCNAATLSRSSPRRITETR
jgi:hypothetical protein